jgi:DNA repair protein RadC
MSILAQTDGGHLRTVRARNVGHAAPDVYPCWVRVELVREQQAPAFLGRPLRTPAAAAAVLCPLLAREARETMLALLLDARARPNAIHRVSLGGLEHCPCEPREAFQAAILADAAALILAHNYPGGGTTPSMDDLTVTLRMARVGALLGIPLRDHLVVGADGWTSLHRDHPELWAEVITR